MKWRLFSILFLLPFLTYGNESAYKALRALGAQRGEAILNHVIEVTGVDGAPQPAVWKITLDDPAARGGVRQIEMANGQIVSEHTPLRDETVVGAPQLMDFQHLNLDSPGAFTVANQEAVRLGVSFDRVDYKLHVSEDRGIPVWSLKLLDTHGNVMQTVRISADKGLVLHGETSDHYVGTTTTTTTTVDGAIPPPPPDAAPPVVVDDNSGDNSHGVGHQIDKGLHHVGADLEQFFTGHRTIEDNYNAEHGNQ